MLDTETLSHNCIARKGTKLVSTSDKDGVPTYEPAFGAFEYFPENLEWSTQMLRLFSYC